MGQFLLYVPIGNKYLGEWFVNLHGGNLPVHLIRGSVESKILEVFLTKLPPGRNPQIDEPDCVPVIIPSFRNKPPEIYNYLPAHAMNYLVSIIRQNFDVQLWLDLHRFGKITKEQKELINAWMEKNGIEVTDSNWNAIQKRYQRQREVYLTRERAKKHYHSKKSH